MLKEKERIRKILKRSIAASFIIKKKELPKEEMDKRTFTEVIKHLKDIEDRRDFMQSEIGMDVTQYEDKFFAVIEGLFKIAFNQTQLSLIQTYLYQRCPDKEWDGTITLEKDGAEPTTYRFKTPEEVWDVIKGI